MPPLVTDRDCGECTVCCKVLPADALDFKKTSGTACSHCSVGRGCKIYQARPSVCREFYCGWRYLPLLDAAWRPDQSGILIVFEEDDSTVPPEYDIRPVIKFLVTGPKSSVLELQFIRYLNGLIHRGAPSFLAVPGPPGCFPVKAFLNDLLKEEVARADGRGIALKLSGLYDHLAEGEFHKVTFARDLPQTPTSARARTPERPPAPEQAATPIRPPTPEKAPTPIRPAAPAKPVPSPVNYRIERSTGFAAGSVAQPNTR